MLCSPTFPILSFYFVRFLWPVTFTTLYLFFLFLFLYLVFSPREYELADLVPYFYGVMYRPCWMVSPPHFVFNTVAYLLEQSPFAPYLTRDVLRRVRFAQDIPWDDWKAPLLWFPLSLAHVKILILVSFLVLQ